MAMLSHNHEQRGDVGVHTLLREDLDWQAAMLQRLLSLQVLKPSNITQLALTMRHILKSRKNSEDQASKSIVRPDPIVRPHQMHERSYAEMLEFFRDKIVFPKDKKKQPFLTLYVSHVRTASNAVFLAAIASGEFEGYFYQPDKYFLRGQNLPGEQLVLPEIEDKQYLKYFMKFTIGLNETEIVDPARLLIDLGYDPNKISVISGVRKPVDTYLSIRRLEVDALTAKEFGETYNFLMTLITNYMLNYKYPIQKKLILVFELLEEFDNEMMAGLMEKMFGKRFDPAFPTEKALRSMENVHWLEADPDRFPDYYEKFIAPVLKQGRFKHFSATNRRRLLFDHPDLLSEVEEIEGEFNLVYEAILQMGAETMYSG